MAARLEKVIAEMRKFGASRKDALEMIAARIEVYGMYAVAKVYEVLEGGIAEEFALEFMSAYNAEIAVRY